jgi:hypothetical protein
MAMPALPTRVEETNNLSRERISATQVRPFAEITSMATPAAVIGTIAATVLLGEDVFDVKSRCRSGGIWKVAVLTAMAGSFSDELPKGPLHPPSRDRLSIARALA